MTNVYESTARSVQNWDWQGPTPASYRSVSATPEHGRGTYKKGGRTLGVRRTGGGGEGHIVESFGQKMVVVPGGVSGI